MSRDLPSSFSGEQVSFSSSVAALVFATQKGSFLPSSAVGVWFSSDLTSCGDIFARGFAPAIRRLRKSHKKPYKINFATALIFSSSGKQMFCFSRLPLRGGALGGMVGPGSCPSCKETVSNHTYTHIYRDLS